MKIDISKLDSSCLYGSYRELAELIGIENTIKIYDKYGGGYLSLPKKFLDDDYIHQQILHEYNGKNTQELAKKYGYTYSWVRKLIKTYKKQKEVDT